MGKAKDRSTDGATRSAGTLVGTAQWTGKFGKEKEINLWSEIGLVVLINLLYIYIYM